LIEAEQRCHPNKCIFHLSKTHQTENCAVKKECDCILAGSNPKHSNVPDVNNSTTGHLRHITKDSEVHEDVDDQFDNQCDLLVNDTNEDALLYFERLSKHYLRIVKSSPTVSLHTRHTRKFPVIADSGAYYHMFKDKEFFESISLATGNVILGDGKTTGIGTVKCKVGSNILLIPNVRYIPELSESIYSLFLHIRSPGHGLDSSFQCGLYLSFPSFRLQAIIRTDDIYLDMLPITTDEFHDDNLPPSPSSNLMYCQHFTQVEELSNTNGKQDGILQDLRAYYDEVKTKRQLGLNVPAGFRPQSNHQKQFVLHTPPRKSTNISPMSHDSDIPTTDHNHTTPIHSNSTFNSILPSADGSVPAIVESPFTPIVRSVDKVLSSLVCWFPTCRHIEEAFKRFVSAYNPFRQYPSRCYFGSRISCDTS